MSCERQESHPTLSPAERRRLLDWAMQKDDGLGFYRGVRNVMLGMVILGFLVWAGCWMLKGG